MPDIRPVAKMRTRWNFCRIRNDETKELVPVYLPNDWRYKRGTKVRWKNAVWTVISCRKDPPHPFLDW